MAGDLHQLRETVSLLGPDRPRQTWCLPPGEGEDDLRGQRDGGVRRAGRAGLGLEFCTVASLLIDEAKLCHCRDGALHSPRLAFLSSLSTYKMS